MVPSGRMAIGRSAQGQQGSLTARWTGRGLTDKSYPGDNRLILPKSPHRRQGLAPRCRLVASWGWRRSQGLGCSPMKAVRELGSERRETVRSLSAVGGLGGCGGLALVREDRAGRTAGGPVVGQPAPLGSYVRGGEPLKASKRESLPKTSLPTERSGEPPGRRPGYEAAGGRRATDRSRAVLRGNGGFSFNCATNGSVPGGEYDLLMLHGAAWKERHFLMRARTYE